MSAPVTLLPEAAGLGPLHPATGPRLLIRDGVDRNSRQRARLRAHGAVRHQQGLIGACGVRPRIRLAISSKAHGFLQRTTSVPLHNRACDLRTTSATLNSRHRKAIKRERREATAAGITIHWLTGKDITEEPGTRSSPSYMETGSRKWGRPYLTRKFFSLVSDTWPRTCCCDGEAQRTAGSRARSTSSVGHAVGRNWGAIEHHPFLHFEVCYYQAIDFAIKRGLKTVEAGAQGEHKIARATATDHLFRAFTSPIPICAARLRII